MRHVTMLTLLLLGSASPATGQLVVGCVGNPTCEYLQAGSSSVQVTLHVTHNGSNAGSANLEFEPDQHPIAPLSTGPNGRATFVWSGTATRMQPAYVVVTATHQGATESRRIEITQTTSAPPYALTLDPHDGLNQTHFSGWKLRDQLGVSISDGAAPLPAATCERTTVSFEAIGPDEEFETVATGVHEHGECVAKTTWYAGESIGEGRVRASIEDHPEAHAEFTVRARKTARPLLGVTLNWSGEVTRARLDTVRYKVPSADPMESPRDTFEVFSSTETRERPTTAAPMIGVDIPLWAFDNQFTHRFRFSLAVGLPDPTDRVFLGLALFQLGIGLPMEGTGIDLHAGALWYRTGSSAIKSVCLPNDPDICRLSLTEAEEWAAAFAIMGTLDASALLSQVAGIVTGLGG